MIEINFDDMKDVKRYVLEEKARGTKEEETWDLIIEEWVNQRGGAGIVDPAIMAIIKDVYGGFKHIHKTHENTENTGVPDVHAEVIPFPNTKGLQRDRLIEARKTIKGEHRNIAIVQNAALSAFTSNPINLAVVAQSSEGKTYLVTEALKLFPQQYVMMLRQASPKVFTREHGENAIRIVNGNTETYSTHIMNKFTDEKTNVAGYVKFLESKIRKAENAKKKEDPEDNDLNIDDLTDELEKIKGNLYRLFDFRNKIIVFLDRPDPALWSELLSVLSHDREFIITSFVEGEGTKYVQHVVFQGWPAVIFCTSKDDDFAWKDLETRFQIIEPVMTSEKYTAAIKHSVNSEFAIEPIDNNNDLTKKLDTLIKWLIQNKPNVMTPFPPEKLADALTGGNVNAGDLMRKIPRILRHVAISTLFNLSERVILKDESSVNVIVAYKDILSLAFLFDDLEFGASLAGLGTGIFELLINVMFPLFDNKPEDSATVKQKDIQTEFFNYRGKCKKDHIPSHLGNSVRSFRNYMTELEKRNLIKRVLDENDKRNLIVIPTWSELPSLASLHDRLKKLGQPMVIADLPKMSYLENRNFEAFLGNTKLGQQHPEIRESEKNIFPQTLENMGFALRYSGYTPLIPDYGCPNFNFIDDTGIKTENTASNETSKSTTAQKLAFPYGCPNFPPETDGDHKESQKNTADPVKSDAPPAQPDPSIEKSLHERLEDEWLPYESVDAVMKALKAYNFEVIDSGTVPYEQPGTWKAQLKGSMDTFTAEQQEALLKGFKIISQGDIFNKNTWIQFRVRTDNKPPAEVDKPKEISGSSDDSGVKSAVMNVLRGISARIKGQRIDITEIAKSWPITSKIPPPSYSKLYEQILPTMAAEGLIKMANGQIEILPGGA